MEPVASPERSVVKITTPDDIVGMLPHRLGFHPAESLVVVCLEGPRQRDRLVMRVDLVSARLEQELARELAGRVRGVGASAAVVVCYTEAAVGAGDRLARARLVDRLVELLRADGIGVIEALLVRDGRWWSYHCADESCCPGSGRLLPAALTPAASHYAAESVANGAVVWPDRDALVRSIEPSGHPVAVAVRAQAAEVAGERLLTAIAHEGRGGVGRLALATLERLVAERPDGPAEVTAEDAATVAVGLRDSQVRDEAMTLVLDHDPELLVALLGDLARLVDDDLAAPLCTVLGWVAYVRGGGALTAVACERALRCEPGYAMAQLLLDGLSGMVEPSSIREIAAAVRTDLRDLDDDLSA